ncbi:SRPBCC domain-containing protein [Neobacillus piezotolerans]|uniref:SRPBCC domain-containing protein n=1 Tax=Neobacillus piezotolerans TaxID=2259171 RepID=A0A3D8GU56_9BACI|nr:SRPBCC domain-containing protein [Neobacillus piezotolerans]RDU38000.1 SRPBCC domain-containing protein [Neobacillus piezotolerans]
MNASLDLVWYAWTLPDRVSAWFAAETVIEPRTGGAYELYFIPGNREAMNTKGCKITKLVDKNELHFTWKGPDQFAAIMNNEDNLTVVKVSLEEIGPETTKITVEHIGFKAEAQWAEALEWHKMAWSGVLGSLKSAIETGKGALCCQPE